MKRHGSPHVVLYDLRPAEVVWRERYVADPATGCWNWDKLDAKGYGDFRDKKAYRWVYEHLVGPVPEGLELDHLCRNRACVNPDHLEPVTHAENNRRAAVVLWGAYTHCVNGHAFDEANTRIRIHSGYRCRVCRQCEREAGARYKARKRAEALTT